MRIDILPKTAPHTLDPGSPRPEGGHPSDPEAFSAVMCQLAAPAASKNRTRSEYFTPEVEQKDDHAAENMAAPVSPFVFEPRGIRQDTMSCGTPAKTEPSARQRSAVVTGTAGAGEGTAIPDQGAATVHRSGAATEIQGVASHKAAAIPASSARSPTGDQVPAGSPEETIVSAAPSAPTVADVPKMGSPETQTMGVSAPPTSMQQPDAGQASEDARALNSVAGGAELQMTTAQAVRSADSAQVIQAGLIAIPALPPASLEAGSVEVLAQESQASEQNSASGSSAVAPLHSDAADAAILASGSPGPDAVTQSRADGVLPAPNQHNVGVRSGEIRPSARHTRTVDQPGAAQATTQILTEARQIPNEFAFVVDSSMRGNLEENLGRSRETSGPAEPKTVKETPGEHFESGADSVESVWAGSQNAQRVLFHSQSTNTGTSDAPVFAGSRPLHPAGSMSSASLEAGLQLPQQAAGTGLKSILAQLSPRPNTPAEAPDFLALLAGRIQMLVRDNQNILTIQLKPSSLGRMEIKAETSAAGVLATIVTESAGVKNYLEHNLPLLQQSFQDQGLKIDRISVAVHDGSWPQQSAAGHQDSPSSSSPHSDSGFRTKPANSFGEPGEELTLDPQTLLALRPNSTFHAIA